MTEDLGMIACRAMDKAWSLPANESWQAVADAVVAAHEARRWRSIETAPKDGTWVLLWLGGIVKPFASVCRWSDSYSIHGLGGNWTDGLCNMGIEVTHWTPIPAPPKEADHAK